MARPGARIGPSTARSGTKVAIISVYTGSRAEHVMSGVAIIVARRRRSLGIVRVAMIAGIAHAKAESITTKLRPSNPKRPITRSASSAARDR